MKHPSSKDHPSRRPRLRLVTTHEQQPMAAQPLDYWDAVPRDGPAVFLASADLLALGVVHGQWLDPRRPEPELRQQLRESLGDQVVERQAWVVFDQVEIGAAMLPEELSLHELRRLVVGRLALTAGLIERWCSSIRRASRGA